MSAFVEATRGLLLPPKGASYNDIRPHHVVVFIGLYKLMKSSSLYRRFTDSILTLLGRTSEAFLPLVYCGVVPDFVIRFGIRLQLKSHLVQLKSSSCEDELSNKMKIVEELSNMPIAIETDLANEQHYEVPPQFYDLCLGPAKKYSSGLWANSKTTFEESETAMLDLYCERAELQDGMKIVDLGCGWGSLTLHLMKKYPNAKVTSISNSHSQREYILKTAQQRGYNVSNLQVITCNVADDKGALDVVKNNDRVMTIEMFEHMKNYKTLLSKVHSFLHSKGKLFVHIFTHKDYTYHFDEGWMSQTFFSGGTMPSDDLLLYFGTDFSVSRHWRVNGTHYEKTSNAWLSKLDQAWNTKELQPVLKSAYGDGKEREWFVNWRLFFLACAELWGFENGQQWIVSHYLFEKR